jgi:hypothetical protein
MNDLPKGFEVVENPRTGMPFLKKKETSGLLGGIVKPKAKTEEKTEPQQKN